MFSPSHLNYGDGHKGPGTEPFMESYPRLEMHPRRKLILDNSSLYHAESMQQEALRYRALSSRKRVTVSVSGVLSAEISSKSSTSQPHSTSLIPISPRLYPSKNTPFSVCILYYYPLLESQFSLLSISSKKCIVLANVRDVFSPTTTCSCGSGLLSQAFS